MSFFCSRLAPSDTPKDLAAVNLFSNHVAKTATAVDLVFKRDLGLSYSGEHSFVRVAPENDDNDKEKESAGNCGEAPCPPSASTATVEVDNTEESQIPPHALCALSDVVGIVAAQRGVLTFVPLANTGSKHVPLSQGLPSGHPIVSLTRLGVPSSDAPETAVVGEKRGRDYDNSASWDDTYIVADAIGNVYLIAGALSALREGEHGKVLCSESKSSKVFPSLPTPVAIVASADSEPMVGALPTHGLGGSGWVGVTIVAFDAASGRVTIAIGREHYRDVRVVTFDIAAPSGSVIASFYPTHAPTSMALLRNPQGVGGWKTLLAVANGPLISCYDVEQRSNLTAAPSSGKQRYSMKSTVRSPFAIITGRKNVWSVTSTRSTTTLSSAASPLPLGESHLLWVAGADRSMAYLDGSRGFMRMHTAPNVLKYDAVCGAAVSPSDAFATGGGDKSSLPIHIAVAGVDCEVRCIAHLEQRLVTAALKGKDGDKKDTAPAAPATSVPVSTAPDTHNPNSFRGRLNSAIHGDDVWVGAWRSFTASNGTTFAAGLTRSGTLYIAA